MKIFVTYSNERYAKARDFAGKMAKRFGKFDKVIIYKPEDIDDDFKEKNKEILSFKKGAGLWLWKPYVVNKALNEECKEGDYLFYADAASFFIRSVDHIIKAWGDQDVFVSPVPLKEWQFTKADCFKLLNCDTDEFKQTAQIQGSFMGFRKSEKSVKFVAEWLRRCCDIRLLHPDNIALHLENPQGFDAHREDQSMLSLLSKQWGIQPHTDLTQYGKYPEKYLFGNYKRVEISTKREYPVCIILHRTANVDKIVALKQLILALVPRKLGLHLIHN